MLKKVSKKDFENLSYKERIRKLITACTRLNTSLLLLRQKDCFVQYVYDIWIKVYSDKLMKQSSFNELFAWYLVYMSKNEEEYNSTNEYTFFKEKLVCWDELSNRQKELLTQIGNYILYG